MEIVAALIAILKATPALIAVLPDIVKLINAIEDANKQATIQVKVKEALSASAEAFKNKDAKAYNLLFAKITK